MTTSTDIRSQFPIFEASKPPLVYLDSAASSQKPTCVIDKMSDMMSYHYANVHRGLHRLSMEATTAFEQGRTKVANFLNAPQEHEIVFVRGLTEGMNLLAQTFGRQHVQEGQVILLSEMEHHSNIIPWMMLAQDVGAKVRFVPILETGELDLEACAQMLTENVAIMSVMHVSNVLGTINPVKDIAALTQAQGVPLIVDGAQAAHHVPVDVQDIGCDFYVVTGHKMYGPTGIGAIWGKMKHLESMPCYHGGGEMVDTVGFDSFTTQAPPAKFEAGTPNIVGAVGLGAAIEFIEDVGMSTIKKVEDQVSHACKEALLGIEGLRIMGDAKDRIGVYAFTIEGCPSADIATLLDQKGVAARVGLHCAEPLHQKMGFAPSVRASIGMYNTKKDIVAFIDALQFAIGMLR